MAADIKCFTDVRQQRFDPRVRRSAVQLSTGKLAFQIAHHSSAAASSHDWRFSPCYDDPPAPTVDGYVVATASAVPDRDNCRAHRSDRSRMPQWGKSDAGDIDCHIGVKAHSAVIGQRGFVLGRLAFSAGR